MDAAARLLADAADGCRRAPKVRRKRAELAAKAGERAAAARAPVDTGRLRGSIEGKHDPQRDTVGIEFPATYLPIVFGVPSRGIPPHDFAERGLEAVGDAMELVLDDLVDAVMGRG